MYLKKKRKIAAFLVFQSTDVLNLFVTEFL